ncbi:Cell division cycle protein 48-like protein [Zancudomyces culisetae]|uniref:Cell division cycle protein 48-like protein n=1 Tax=Zancudomyces culisetae TaxID=1213189 RepID=A0A1R1PJW9_ZANCU|nr:Cell division cycle protein 48-like protein [Zancudomyces culisetae]|eukprot:OMH81265.1 Cell division cycle protein 48-like protein [Zancudomyces culisetae]
MLRCVNRQLGLSWNEAELPENKCETESRKSSQLPIFGENAITFGLRSINLDISTSFGAENQITTQENITTSKQTQQKDFQTATTETLKLIEIVQLYFGFTNLPDNKLCSAFLKNSLLIKGIPGIGKRYIVGELREILGIDVVWISAGILVEIHAQSSNDFECKKSIQNYIESYLTFLKSLKRVVIVIDKVELLAADQDSSSSIWEAISEKLPYLNSIYVIGILNTQFSGGKVDKYVPANVEKMGLFHTRLDIDVPDRFERRKLVRSIFAFFNQRMCKKIEISEKTEELIVNHTPGFIAKDLYLLIKRVISSYILHPKDRPSSCLNANDGIKSTNKIILEDSAFLYCLKYVRPTYQLGYESNISSIYWEDIFGYNNIKADLRTWVQMANHATGKSTKFEQLGVRPPLGILFYGPSGCGKTLFGRALASQSNRNVLVLRFNNLLSEYLGESELYLRNLFYAARKLSPSLILIDELDFIASKRDWSSGSTGSTGVEERLLSTLLNELDGVSSRSDVLLVATTNDLGNIDDAILRPGRFDRLVKIDLPSRTDRIEIIKNLARNYSLDPELDFISIADNTESFTCADLYALHFEAMYLALHEFQKPIQLLTRHYISALDRLSL